MEKTGFYLKKEDHQDLSEKISKIFKMSQKDLNKISLEARKSVEKFRWSTIINKLDNLIKS